MIVAGFELISTHLVPFFSQGFAGLRAGVIEFASLTDDDGAGANQQDFVDVFATWHCCRIPKAQGQRTRGVANVRTLRRAQRPLLVVCARATH